MSPLKSDPVSPNPVDKEKNEQKLIKVEEVSDSFTSYDFDSSMDKSKNADEVVAAAPSKPGIRKKKSTMRKKLKDIEKPTM